MPVDRPVIIELSSKDVIHNFAFTHMRIAQDAIPGQIIPMWFKPIKTGSYEVVCGQLCGLGHYSMKGTLVVDTPADYQAWLKERAELSGIADRAGASRSAAGRTARRPDAREPCRRPARRRLQTRAARPMVKAVEPPPAASPSRTLSLRLNFFR